MYNLSAIFLKCCVPWLRQEPLGHDRREIHFCRVREVRCAEQRGNMDPTPLHQGTNAVAQVPRQRSVTTRSHVPVSFRAQREKKFFDPKKLRPGQTGSFLKIPNLSPSLMGFQKKKKNREIWRGKKNRHFSPGISVNVVPRLGRTRFFSLHFFPVW